MILETKIGCYFIPCSQIAEKVISYHFMAEWDAHD